MGLINAADKLPEEDELRAHLEEYCYNLTHFDEKPTVSRRWVKQTVEKLLELLKAERASYINARAK